MFVVCMNYFNLNWKWFMQNVHFSKKKKTNKPCTVQLYKEIHLLKWDEGGKRGVVSKEVGVPSHLLRGIQFYKL